MRKKELKKIIENYSQDNLELNKRNLQLNKEIEQIKKNPPKYKTGDKFGSEVIISSWLSTERKTTDDIFIDAFREACRITDMLGQMDTVKYKGLIDNIVMKYNSNIYWSYYLKNEDERAIPRAGVYTEKQLDEYVKSHAGKKESTAENPTGLLRKQLREDKEQRECWIANIACSITDAEIDYKKKTGKKNLNSADRQLVYNKGAELFINLLCED